MLWPSAAWSQGGPVVQQIGNLGGSVAEAVISEVRVVPFSPRIDARTTPILLAGGKAYVLRGRPDRVGGVDRAEKRALRQAYEAGQTIVVLGAIPADIEALHVLLGEGVAIAATDSDPISLAYALRLENNVPTATAVSEILSSLRDDDDLAAHDRAFERAIDIVVDDLLHPPVVSEPLPPPTAAGSTFDWSDSPVMHTTFASTSWGVWNTPVDVYALHACQADVRTGIFYDYYLVNTGGNWTATEAKYQAASKNLGELSPVKPDGMRVDWKDFAWDERPSNRCNGGYDVCLNFGCFVDDARICRYVNYPLSYKIEFVPSPGPEIIQVDAQPRGDQGRSTTYSSGFTWHLGAEVNVSGKGPSGRVEASVTWDNTVTTTVPAMAVLAGNTEQQGAYTTYKYCTSGDGPGCKSTVQMSSAGGSCNYGAVSLPQQGQTPDGKLSGVAQTVLWRVNPDSYVGDTFDVEVSWTGEIVNSTSRLWSTHLQHFPQVYGSYGYCNGYGCNCAINTPPRSLVQSYTFKIPIPSKDCPESPPEG